MGKQNVNITVEAPHKEKSFWNVLTSLFDRITNTTDKQFIKVVLLIILFFGGLVAYNLSKQNSQMTKIEKYITQSEEAEEENLQIRDEITPKVQKEMDKLMYQVSADRVCLFEVHNGKANSTSLPFRFADCTQESINSDHMITYVGDRYQNIPLGHYKIPYYLADCKYLLLSYEEMKKYDAKFAQEMLKVNGKHVAAIMLSSNGIHIGFLICFYDNTTSVPDEQILKNKLTASSKIISTLLDLNIQRQLRFKTVENN